MNYEVITQRNKTCNRRNACISFERLKIRFLAPHLQQVMRDSDMAWQHDEYAG
jgi:hypothetical protein